MTIRIAFKDTAGNRLLAGGTRIQARKTLLMLVLLLAGLAPGMAQKKPQSLHPYPPQKDATKPAWFVDVAAQAGLTMLNVNGNPASKSYIIETTGSGVAIMDYDRDGWPDILLLNGKTLDGEPVPDANPTKHLYHNNHDGTFTDVTETMGMLSNGWAQGACAGDYDNDGFDDVFVTYYGKNRLYHNEGGKRFREVAAPAGVAGNGSAWGTGCAFVDYDRDGKLDLMVANYVQLNMQTLPKPGDLATCIWKGIPVMCGPRGLPFTTNLLYHNVGGGKFEDVTQSSGIAKTYGHYCFSVSTLDYNRDGWPDIYIACDSTPSILYKNNHDGTFTDVAADAGVAYDEDGREQAGMGSAIGDYNDDGWPDIFKTNFSDDTSSLYLNGKDGTFTSTIFDAGLGLNTRYLGWGTTFLDLDNSGILSVLIVNGHVYPQVDQTHSDILYKEPRLLYLNLGNGKFKDISALAGPGLTTSAAGRGLATADLWNDGRIATVVNNADAKPSLLLNMAVNDNHWIGIALHGTRSNRDGIGARVTVQAGQHAWFQEVRSGSSYISSSDLRLHFGLGAATSIVGIDVEWPSGLREHFATAEVNHIVTLEEGRGTANPHPPENASH